MLNELKATIAKITENGKGILAADESTSTIKKRFDSINLCRPLEGWHRYSVSAEWKGRSAGGRSNPHRNPQFAFTVVEMCDVFVEVRAPLVSCLPLPTWR